MTIGVDFWEQRYQTGDILWDRGAVSPALVDWFETGALTPCRVLVPGCGRGYEVLELARLGFEVTALDYADSAISAVTGDLAEAGLKAEVIQADALVWQPEQPFDAVYEQTCLCALSPGSWTVYAKQLSVWLRPAGKLFILFMQTEPRGGLPYHCDMKQMRELFPQDTWQWPASPLPAVPHPMGCFEYAAMLYKLKTSL
jgi:methyl halide transferase